LPLSRKSRTALRFPPPSDHGSALFDAGIDGGVVAWVHDEICLEVPKADAPQAMKLLEQAMLDAFEQTFPGSEAMGLLKGLVDIGVGDSWAAAKEKKSDGR
jgi:DNA polymerase I-like protein with 3'-5' exonuclease and polymerase domains